ncbi:MAG: fumarate hydratase, partial [Geminicoccaceae bacterium]
MISARHPKLFQISVDNSDYRLVTTDGVAVQKLGDRRFLVLQPEAIARLTEEAFADISHLLRPAHLAQLQKILDDPDASANDRFVASELLKNAVIAAARQFPSCQDTGTAIISGKKGQDVLVDGDMHDAFHDGIARTWATRNLRFSQMAPLSMFEEQNTGTN